MKKFLLRFLPLILILCTTCLVGVSCKSSNAIPVVQQSDTTSYIQKNESQLSTLNSQLFHSRDSIVYREKMIHDTVYITKEVYRDRLEARGERQKAVRTDTVVVTEWREKVIEHPPERYVPKFYKWCTIALWAIGLLAIGNWALKRWL